MKEKIIEHNNFWVITENKFRYWYLKETRAAYAMRVFDERKQNYHSLRKMNTMPSTLHLIDLMRLGYPVASLVTLMKKCFPKHFKKQRFIHYANSERTNKQ